MRSRTLKIAVGIGAAVVVAGGIAGAAGIASADPTAKSQTYVDGFGDLNDDWNDNEREAGVLCDGCDNSQGTDLVMMWQSVLMAEGIFDAENGDFDEYIDGYFGPETAEATKIWQESQGQPATGKVDQRAWAAADNVLEHNGSEIIYRGAPDGAVVFTRDEDSGVYHLQRVSDGDGETVYNVDADGKIWLSKQTISLGDEEA